MLEPMVLAAKESGVRDLFTHHLAQYMEYLIKKMLKKIIHYCHTLYKNIKECEPILLEKTDNNFEGGA